MGFRGQCSRRRLLQLAAGVALRKHPLMNAAFTSADGGGIRYNDDINVAMAVALDGDVLGDVQE